MYTIADSSSFGVLPGDKTLAELRLPTFGESGDPTPPPPLTKPTSEAESGKKAGDAEASPFTLGEGLPPVPAKLVSKIRKGEYVDMAELLRDNMELERRRDLRSAASSALGLIPPTSRREVPDLLSWIQCFGMYAAVLSNSYPNKVQQLYAYQTMIVREARRCGEKRWLAYDQMFRQQAAISPADWSKLNNSLYSTTFLQQQNGRGRTCTHCMETDHVANECSLARSALRHRPVPIRYSRQRREGAKDVVPKFVTHGMMAAVPSPIVVTATYVQNAAPPPTRQCTAAHTLPGGKFRRREMQRTRISKYNTSTDQSTQSLKLSIS